MAGSRSRSTRWLRILAGGLASAVTFGCHQPDTSDPRLYPFRFKVERTLSHRVSTADLDGDGVDEVLLRYTPTQMEPPVMEALLLQRADGRTIDQLNYSGRVLPPLVRDIDGDGAPEIVVPVLRHDSLFLSIADGTGRKRFAIYLTAGEPRHEPEGDIRWDPNVVEVHALDVTGDGHRELITVFNAGYARRPRGVFVHTMPGGEQLGFVPIGSPAFESIVDDFDEDGRFELVLSTSATFNGGDAGGFDDAHSYLIVLELAAQPRLEWYRETGGMWSGVRTGYADFDGDGREELLAMVAPFGAEQRHGSRVEFIEPGTWRVKKVRPVIAALAVPPAIVDLDRDSRPEIVAVRRDSGEVWQFDAELNVVRKRGAEVPLFSPKTVTDLDGDGIADVVARSTTGIALLGADLRVKAVFRGVVAEGVFQASSDARPLLLLRGDTETIAASLDPNPLWIYYRHRGILAGIAGVLVSALVMLASWGASRRGQLLRAVEAIELDGERSGVLLVSKRGAIRWMNGTLRRWLEGGTRSRPRDVSALTKVAPELAAFCQTLLEHSGPMPRPRKRRIRLDGRLPDVEAVAGPIMVGLAGEPHWLVRVDDPSTPSRADQLRTWSMMAERVAHGLKNPLTSMLLTLQRLQIEYREHAPAVANRLDRYTTRLEERVGELRRLTSNFLKVVNLQAPDLEPVDLGALARDFADRQRRSLPPDIRLSLKLQPKLPAAMLDREQVLAALDNLIANAMNAMPEGGTISLSTGQACGIRLPDADGPADYVTLEVLDTGAGIPEGVRQRIFEPGFTTAEGGSGLGLAIVKKVVMDHGGSVLVESEVGTGSGFTIYLPTTPPEHRGDVRAAIDGQGDGVMG